ncbi:hypothetical protein, partial [Escherichia coli]|uniref:hypothetical protein n=1 Tax=Escherichia coli TaxID=562 RepID=UPI001BC8C8E4
CQDKNLNLTRSLLAKSIVHHTFVLDGSFFARDYPCAFHCTKLHPQIVKAIHDTTVLTFRKQYLRISYQNSSLKRQAPDRLKSAYITEPMKISVV